MSKKDLEKQVIKLNKTLRVRLHAWDGANRMKKMSLIKRHQSLGCNGWN